MAGIDEAGRGPIAGPVVAAAVVFDFEQRRPIGLKDSKLLPLARREKLFRQIQRSALAYGVGIVHAAEIDLVNILEATRLAALRALDQVAEQLGGRRVGALVTDALDIPAALLPINPIVKGDRKSSSIAAASILAKVTRDRMMDAYHEEFPDYGWNSNRGYPTEDHLAAVNRHGPTSLHRFSFNGVGFFTTEPRRSLTFKRLSKLIAASPPTSDARLAVEAELDQCAERMPPPDVELLRERIRIRFGT